MRITYVLFFLLTSFSSLGQCFGIGREWVGAYNISDYLESKDTLNVVCYNRENHIDSLLPICKCIFTKLPIGVIKSQCSEIGVKKKEKFYWVYDKEGYVWISNKKGSLKAKEKYTGFYSEETIIHEEDSIVNRYSWIVLKKDTVCEGLNKSIYKEGKKIEFWETPVLLGNTSKSWDSIKNYTVFKYAYPSESKQLEAKFRINENRDTTYRYKSILEYDKSHHLICASYCNEGNVSWKRLYFYENGILSREEHWMDGRIEELLKFE